MREPDPEETNSQQTTDSQITTDQQEDAHGEEETTSEPRKLPASLVKHSE
jgi:hypothetical protein